MRFGEAGAQALQTAPGGARIVNHTQYYALELEGDAFREFVSELGAVDIAVNRCDGAQPPKILEHRRPAEVTGVDDQVRRAEQVEARLRQNTGCACRRTLGSKVASRHVSVGDQRQPQRLRLAALAPSRDRGR